MISSTIENTTLKLFHETRKHTERLCENLETEDYGLQAAEFVSPVKWHMAHSSWFFETFLLNKLLENYSPFHPRFNFFFNSYYEAVGQRTVRAERGQLSRPTVKQIFDYRKHVDEHINQLENIPAERWEELLTLGIQHEKQHQELILTDLKYCLGLNPLFPAVFQLNEQEKLPPQGDEFITIEKGIYPIGYSGKGFCFDNEKEVHEVLIPSFEIAANPVSNEQFLAFIEDGGYRHSQWWHMEGWEWVKTSGAKAPLHWHYIENTWHFYTLDGLEKLNLEAPATHINYYEASAFAAWAGKRLPTEFEWEVASQKISWGKRWEWTQSAYLPYPGYSKAPGAIGEYNGKFMVNQMVLRGGSVASPTHHIRPTYRNFFHPQMQWQFTGFRLVKS